MSHAGRRQEWYEYSREYGNHHDRGGGSQPKKLSSKYNPMSE
jgi:hypothetical protein